MSESLRAEPISGRAVFVHDHVFGVHADGTVFSSGQLHYTILRRYLRHFRELTVVARRQPLSEPKGQSPATGPGVTFRWLPSEVYRRPTPVQLIRATAVLEETLDGASAVIVRVPSLAGFWGAMIAERRGVPWAVEVVGCAYDGLRWHGSLVNRAMARPVALATRALVRRAQRALYVTESFLQRRYPCDGITAVASNVDVSVLPEERLPQVYERLRRREGEPMRIGMLASLKARYKGIETLLRALASLEGAAQPFVVEIAGPGDAAPWMALAKRLGIGHRVSFLGVLPPGEGVCFWLDTLHVYVQPSLTEGLPRGVIEAMSRGLPCLASNVGGIPELLPTTCLHEPGDVEGLRRLLERALRDPQWCMAAVQPNHQRAGSFDCGILDERRAAFWGEFAREAYARKRGC